MKPLFRIAAVAVMSVLVLSTSVVSAPPAAAVTKHPWSITVTGGKVTGSWWISGGRTYVSGKVCDTKADNMAAMAGITFAEGWSNRSELRRVSGGYGACLTFAWNSQYTGSLTADLTVRNDFRLGARASKTLFS